MTIFPAICQRVALPSLTSPQRHGDLQSSYGLTHFTSLRFSDKGTTRATGRPKIWQINPILRIHLSLGFAFCHNHR
jgi:hypothetical protein